MGERWQMRGPPGFALRVTEARSRSFVYVYRSPLRIAAAPKVFLSLGDAAHVSLAEAREQARQAHSLRDSVRIRRSSGRADDELAAVLLRSAEVSAIAAAYVRVLALCGTRRT